MCEEGTFQALYSTRQWSLWDAEVSIELRMVLLMWIGYALALPFLRYTPSPPLYMTHDVSMFCTVN
jgi:hypothetical protein